MHLVTFEQRSAAAAAERPRVRERRASMGDAALGFEALEPPRPGQRRLGALVPGGPFAGSVVDLNRVLAVKLAAEDVGAPEAEADSLLPADVRTFLKRLPGSLEAAAEALEFASDALARYDGPDVLRAGAVLSRDRVRLCAPVPRPGKIVAVARNYPALRSGQRGAAAPTEPALFLVAPSAVIGPEDEIEIPAAAKQVDCEGGLAVVIGRSARRASAEEALEHVAGYCAANSITARDHPEFGRSCDSFAPLGPALLTADEVPNPQELTIRTALSGEIAQSASTKEMIFSVAEILSFVSALMTLEPGDVVFTGSPAGPARRKRRGLRDGDVVEVTIDRVGVLRNYVRSGV